VPAVWWLDQPHVQILGVVSLTAGLLCIALGIRRFFAIRRVIAESSGRQASV
jgi:putative membrane protein